MSAGTQFAVDIAAQEYWRDKIARGTAVRLWKASAATEIRVSLEPALAARVERATAGEPDALLIVGMAALAVLAERYTCCETPLLAGADAEGALIFAPSIGPAVTGRALIDGLNDEFAAAVGQADSLGTAWGCSVSGFKLHGLELWIEWLGADRLVMRAAEGAEQLARHYVVALQAILTSPDRRVRDIEILDDSDRRRLAQEYNSNATPLPAESLAMLFEEQVRSRPDAIALVDCGDGERFWTYAELDRAAQDFAGGLNIEAEELVPVMGARSARVIVEILGILKAGGAYVPIDPEWPPDRIAAVRVDVSAQAWRPALRFGPLAYVMYTSGSTGQPKGVMIEQRSVVRLVRNTNYIELGPDERILQTGSMAFDAATLEIWGALLNGGTLVLAPTEDLLDPARLKQLLHRHRITTIWLTATWFHQLVDTDLSIFAGLRHLLAGGERLSVPHVNAVRRALPNLRITNGYGPTENTTFTTCHAIEHEYDDDIPIGRPVANTSVIVLDVRGRLAPEGAAGELCTGGAGVARGYLNDPELTARKFVDGLYRTGDRARWREDGTLEFLGRLDDQIKLRGFRIELGEIEAVLGRHPAVAQTVAAVREDKLAVWIVCRSKVSQEEIRDFAATQLPAWMVPARYVFLDRLPLNRNGKVDRAALILPDEETDSVAPRTTLESRIAAIWEDVLGRGPVGVHSNFFELGGHSLKATALIAKLNRQANIAISIRDLFQCPTVEQLAQLAEERGGLTVDPIPVLPQAEAYAVSPAQRRLWVLDQLDPGNVAYNMPACFLIEGALDVEALQLAVRALVARHEILRTRFESRQGEPVQIVEQEALDLECQDISLERLRDEMLAEAARPFALDRLPLFRARLFRIGQERHALAVHLHHIIGDAWSSEILLRELARLYSGDALSPLRIQYRDAAAWQNAQLQSGVLAGDLSYWKQHLAGPLPALDLPADDPRPPLQVFDGRTISFRFGAARTRAFEELRQKLGAQNTPFAILLASLYVLLNRLSGQEDLVVGIPVAGRYHPDLHDQVGFYVNTLALRQKLAPEEDFGELLKNVHEMLAEAYDHQAFPFERLVEELDLRRDISRGAVFDVFAAYQDQEHFLLDLAGLRTEVLPIESAIAKFDLSFYFSQGADGLVCSIEFNTRLFAPETIERFASHLFALIDDLVKREGAGAIADLELLDQKAKQQILVDFNRTARDYPPGDTLVSLFEAQGGSHMLLNARANYIARWLRERGIRRGDLVAVHRERDLDTVAALLGVLKAGAAYVPIDPAYPAERVRYLLEDSHAKLVLTDIEPGEDSENPPLAAGPGDLAYIIYTSGSTGAPKGVAIEHRAAATFIHWCKEEFTEKFDVVFAGTSLCFDLSIFELFYTLAAGKRIRLLRSGLEIADWLTRDDRIAINTVPSVVKDLLASGADFSRVVTLNMAGEPIPLGLVETLQRKYPHLVIRNLYGPSEDTTYSTCYRFPPHAGRVLVGRPVANTDAYILDSRLHPVPMGVTGELYLSGDKLAREYLGKAELTKEKFIANPFRPGGRMYRTQDLARWTPDGNIDFLGRSDDQVKIRGFRIEPGEIEHALRKDARVKDAAVIPNGDCLMAFVAAQSPVTTNDLRDALGITLPAYMIPARFSIVPELPLTPNGKTDRKALRSLAASAAETTHAIVEPRDEIERTLAKLWKSVLQRAPIGVTDNFFDLGGHSLKATRLLAQAASALGVAMPLKAFFAAPTVAAQAAWFRDSKPARIEPIPALPPAEHYELSPAQMRLWVLAQLNPESRAYHMPGVFRIEGPLDPARLGDAFASVVARHESLRTRFVMVDGNPRQVIDPDLRLEISVGPINVEELDRPFDLSVAPPLRVALCQIGPEEFTLAFVMHHLAGDGWSLNVLVKEVLAAYTSGSAGAPLRNQYKDYAAWLNARLERGDLDDERTWWHQTLAASLPVLELPTDFPRPAVQGYEGAGVTFQIPTVIPAGKATLFAWMLAAFQTLMFRYTGQGDVIIGTPASGRIHPDLEDQIGLYMNTLALRGRPRAELTFAELLAEAQQTTWNAVAHQLYPFDRLVDELELARDLSRSAVFDVMLVVEQERVQPVLPGLRITEALIGVVHSKFDLTLYVSDSACRFVYNTALFKRQRIERMARHFQNLIAAVVAKPEQTITHIDVLDTDERERLVHTWNRTEQAHPFETAVARFERIAASMPERIAVAGVTYGELNARANGLAEWLRDEHGVVAGDRVAVMLPADERLPEALIATWKAGATYVPVDPANPEARVRAILADCGARVVLRELPAPQSRFETGLQVGNLPHPAYMIYTSGTTGTPKGARQPHQALVNYVCWLNRAFGIGPKDCSGLVSSYAFDLGYTALWGTLLNGGELVLGPPRDPDQMIDWIVEHRLTYLKATPSLFEMLLGAPNAGELAGSSLRLILLGGEPLRLADVRRFLAIRPGTRFVNHYGPTETTIGSIAGELEDFESEPTLGKPIDNTRIYIVDTVGEAVPVGVPGEIWIAGAGVGLDRTTDGLYHTGDRGCWTEDGRVRFLGRIDSQVKIRGYRVELREVEVAIREHPGVSAAAVIAQDGELVAGVVGSATDLREFLSARLPEYMIPSRFAFLEQLPLTPNGKLDTRALSAAAGAAASLEIVTPRNAMESNIAEMWCEVLRRDRAGVRHDFFLSGGHSLRAASLLSRVYRATGVSIGLREFFASPTIEWLAATVQERGARTRACRVETLLDAGRGGQQSADTARTSACATSTYELSPAQERLWLLQHIDPQGLAYSMPSGFALEGPLDVDRFRRAVEIVVARHETLRTVFVAVDGRPRQRVLDACESVLADDIERPFDLERGPLLRIHLHQTGDEQWVLRLNMHHIVSDGWSMGVLARELLEAYRDPSEAPPLALQYRDFAAWQRNASDGKSREYWLAKFKEPPEPLELPIDRPRPAAQSFAGDRVTFRFSRDIEGIAAQNRATLFMTLAAGVQVLLARYTGQRDICIGTAEAGRSTPELENLIGLFVRTLPLRNPVDPQANFGQFLGQVRDTVLEAFDHADYPFDRLVEEVGAARDLSRNPLFDVMVVLQNTEPLTRDFGGVRAIPLEPPRGTAKFDLNFVFTAEDDGIRLDLEYATALFDQSRIERLCRHLETLLADAAGNPARPIGELKLLTTEEDRVWRGEERQLDEATVIDLFERRAARTPDACALEFSGGTLTFAELNERANRVAHALQGHNELIALQMPRSEWLVVAILGVWKSGAVWLPLDPTHPAGRLKALASHAQLTLTETDVRAMSASGSAENPERTTKPEDLAYVLFTSGSTGEPKGCMLSHGSIQNYIDWAARMYPVGKTRYTLHSAITFDLTLTSLLCPLVRGETLRIYPQDMPVDQMLLDTFELATFVKLTPSHITLLDALAISRTSVKVAVVGGEAMTAAHVRTLRRLNPDMRIINEYGPTETTVGSMWYEAGDEPEGPISIGHPIQNTEIQILDAQRQPVPEGVAGEICIGGAGVSRGYLGRPDLTAERFRDGVYRTGDFGCRSANGFKYLGRRDGQVKVRGHRVELAEVEASLIRCGARQAVVDLRDGALIAWVVGSADETALARMLPDYMLPARILVVDEIPINAHGKVDRKGLPDPGALESDTFEPPATERERVLAEVWSALLGIERIGRCDHFFRLGGDSIRAVQMSYRLRDRGWKLDVPALFAAPTLAEAAPRMEASSVREVRQPRGDVLPLTPIQQWFFATQKAGRNWFNQSVLLGLPADVDLRRLEEALNVVVAQHAALRLRFRDGGQVVAPHERIELQRIDKTEVHESLDIEHGPILRATLIDSKLLLVIHHLAVDGYSWRILIEDLEAAYRGVPLAAATDSFGAWAEALPAGEQDTDATNYLASQARQSEARLSPEETSDLLGPAGRAYNTNPQELLLAALSAALGQERLYVVLEGHGRDVLDGFDVSRTVGWFTRRYPVEFGVGSDPGRLVKGVKEAVRGKPQDWRPALRVRVSFNYLGQFDSNSTGLFRILAEGSGPNVGPEIVLTQELNVVAVVVDGTLITEFTSAEETQALCDRFIAEVRRLLAHCLAATGAESTPSDFTFKGLSLDELEGILDEE